MTTLVVSPHLDDAVLSYGGHLVQLADAGEHVVVYTVFAGSPTPPYSPIATTFHDQWAIVGDPVAARRDENDAALAALGIDPPYLCGPFLDSIYRRNAQGGWVIDDENPMDHHADDEDDLVAAVAADIERVIGEFSADRVVTCAAVGNHVDHRRTRDSVLAAVARTGSPLSLWDDFPYLAWPGVNVMPPLPAGVRVAEPVAVAVSDTDWARKLRAVGAYASQIAMLESGGQTMSEQYADDCANRRGQYGVDGFYETVREVLAVTDSAPLRSAAR
ncbi:PIG-L family deacetylase [Micromonospora sp. NPDC049004]|uniref:PIG-L deacetylase family protein n=1 Tax=Micromonospora sp. NPDC049004 TaxID=3154348 RepID=UPI0033C7E431